MWTMKCVRAVGVFALATVVLALAFAVGTGLAGALSQHFGLAFVVLSVMFATSLILGLKTLRRGAQRRT